MNTTSTIALTGLAVALTASMASASVVRIAEAAFKPTAGLITFSEFPQDTENPSYTPSDYGGGAGAPNVTTGGWFLGQRLSTDPGTDCPGAAASACIVGTPNAGLSFDPDAPKTFITGDGANPTSPVLSGFPTFNGGIALLFSIDQTAVGFTGGFFDALNSTGITAFDRNGDLLGTIANTGTGIEFLGLVTDDGLARIAGVFLDLIGSEPAGFAVDNIRFGLAGDVVLPPDVAPVPLPAAGWMLFGAIGGLAALRRRRMA